VERRNWEGGAEPTAAQCRVKSPTMSIIRMQTALEEIPLDKPSLLEDMLLFLSLYTTDKELFNSYEKDRGILMK
jgi:hypothetical protein